jgi:phage portal protein BeeE
MEQTMKNDNPFLMVDQKGNYKSFDFSPWGGIEGFLEMSKNSSQNGSAYKRLVPDLFRAVDMTATAVASLPFDICDEEENVIDSSVDWENVVGGMENPQRLIYLLASSLCGGAAYVIPQVMGSESPVKVFTLQYVSPASITPHINREGLQWFDRASDQGMVQRFMPEQLMYFWLPDSDVELGPALSHPLGVAMAAAGLSLNMSNSLIKISERGFIPPTIMGVDGMTLPGEKERVERWWNSFLKGAFSQIAKIVNAQKVTITQVGAGMEQLKGTYVELKREASEDIAKAFGIPAAVFMSDKAFATEYNPLIKQWYSNSIFTTIYHTIEETFTEQLLKQFGYSFYFRPESLDAFQDDENARGQAVATLTNAIDTNPKVAMWVMEYVLGYDLTEEAENDYESLVQEREEQAAQIQQQEQANAEPMQNDTEDEPPAEKPAPFRSIVLTAPMIEDLKTWNDMADRFYKKGKELPIEFECKGGLPEEIAAPIRQKLKTVKNEIDLMHAFDLDRWLEVVEAQGVEHIKALALAITQAAEKQLPPNNITINTPPITLNAQMPEQGQVVVNVPQQPAPSVIVNTPEAAAPVVNIKNDVQPAVNNITVEPAKVVIPALPTEATIETDARGKKTLKVK